MEMKDIKRKISELKELALKERLNISYEIKQLESKLTNGNNHSNSAWAKVKLSRLIERPTTLDYIDSIFDQFIELHGDRCFSDDPAMVGGIGLLNGKPVTIIGQQRGRNLKENLKRNGGMALPEGYRKALRLVRQAEKFGRPVISFVDTQGAYGGVAAEERGIGEAIARNLKEFFEVKTPIVVVLIGQGGSGGALAIGIGDSILMLENATYSVISPEGCASILLRDGSKAQFAASIMKPTARDLYYFKIIDEIIEEPSGGAHLNPEVAAANVKNVILRELDKLMAKPKDQLLKDRFDKFRHMGVYYEKKEEKKGLLRRLFGGRKKSERPSRDLN
jgi:acetyl-CoA carboxylase carboxyl transferase subunit alpha